MTRLDYWITNCGLQRCYIRQLSGHSWLAEIFLYRFCNIFMPYIVQEFEKQNWVISYTESYPNYCCWLELLSGLLVQVQMLNELINWLTWNEWDGFVLLQIAQAIWVWQNILLLSTKHGHHYVQLPHDSLYYISISSLMKEE